MRGTPDRRGDPPLIDKTPASVITVTAPLFIDRPHRKGPCGFKHHRAALPLASSGTLALCLLLLCGLAVFTLLFFINQLLNFRQLITLEYQCK